MVHTDLQLSKKKLWALCLANMTVTIIRETHNKSISEEDSQYAVETFGDDMVRQSQTIIL